jgi:hypothetical protein
VCPDYFHCLKYLHQKPLSDDTILCSRLWYRVCNFKFRWEELWVIICELKYTCYFRCVCYTCVIIIIVPIITIIRILLLRVVFF